METPENIKFSNFLKIGGMSLAASIIQVGMLPFFEKEIQTSLLITSVLSLVGIVGFLIEESNPNNVVNEIKNLNIVNKIK